MIGDSWTDLLFGVPAVQTLRYHLETSYGYRITGATLGGQRLSTVLGTGLHFQTIDQAGADLRYVLLSLGGNDLLNNPGPFASDMDGERSRRFQQIANDLNHLVATGNAYKISKYGGKPLIWIVHGYDYPNPDNEGGLSDTLCRSNLRSQGIPDALVEEFASVSLNKYNQRLAEIPLFNPDIRYINLLGTLGGPPYSPRGQMVDCLHPSSIGFKILTDRYVSQMKIWTGEDR